MHQETQEEVEATLREVASKNAYERRIQKLVDRLKEVEYFNIRLRSDLDKEEVAGEELERQVEALLKQNAYLQAQVAALGGEVEE